MSVFISYIIPAYNSSRYITKAIESIFSQNWNGKSVEVIIVDDGSTDKTPAIVRNLQKTNTRIQYIAQENSGPAKARNLGILHAKGEYLSFADADDTLSDEASGHIIDSLSGSKSDVFIFGFNLLNTQRQQTLLYTSVLQDVKDAPVDYIRGNLHILYESNLLNQVWNKVFRKDFIISQNITFKDYRYGEDRLFILDAIDKSANITVNNGAIYNYYIRNSESLITKFYDKKFDATLEIDRAARSVARIDDKSSVEVIEVYEYMFIKGVISSIVNYNTESCPYGSRKKRASISHILNHSVVKRSLSHRFNRPLTFRVVCLVLRSRNITFAQIIAAFINAADRLAPALFINLKHRGNR